MGFIPIHLIGLNGTSTEKSHRPDSTVDIADPDVASFFRNTFLKCFQETCWCGLQENNILEKVVTPDGTFPLGISGHKISTD